MKKLLVPFIFLFVCFIQSPVECREHTLVDTPVAVQSFSSDDLNSLPKGRDFSDIANLTPGVVPGVTSAAPGGDVNIRGLNGAGQSFSIDGFATSNPIVDLGDVEVLRGPQGTLFGRNSIPGVINVVTKSDGQQFGSDAGLDSDYSATLGGPLVKDRLWFFGNYARIQEENYNADELLQGAYIGMKFKGFDNPTGSIGNLTFNNYTGNNFNFYVPRGMNLIPNDYSVQRMQVTEPLKVTLPPIGSFTSMVTGLCLDPFAYPPPSISTTTGQTPSTAGQASDGGSTTSQAPSDSPDSMLSDWSFSHFGVDLKYDLPLLSEHTFLYGRQLIGWTPQDVSVPYISEFAGIPAISDVVKEMIQNAELEPTGLPSQVEEETIQQWSVWNFTQNFDQADGETKIAKQVADSGGSQTPEQIGQLNENIWKNVDLVKKKIKAQASGAKDAASQQSRLKGRPNPVSAFTEKITALLAPSAAYAENAVNPEDDPHIESFVAINKALYVLAKLQNLTFDLEKLADSPYARKQAKFGSKSLKRMRGDLGELQGTMKQSRAQFNPKRPLSAEDYLKVRDINGGLYVHGGAFDTYWQGVKSQTAKAYERWDRAYMELLQRSNRAVEAGGDYAADMNRDELQFFKIFSRVKWYYKILERIYG